MTSNSSNKNKSSNHGSNSGSSSNNNRQSNNSSNNNWNPGSSSSNKNKQSNSGSSAFNPVLKNLGPDSKLLPAEKQWPINQGLCLVCGIKGHIAKECQKAHDKSNNSNSSSGTPSSSNNKTQAKAQTSETKDQAAWEPETDSKKIIRTLTGSTRLEGCIVSDHTGTSIIFQLNTSALSSLNSLTIKLTSKLLPVPFMSLIDSSSSHCFIETKFMKENDVVTYQIDPLLLSLFDGTINCVITEAVDILITFPMGEVTPMTLYITTLDSSCSVVELSSETSLKTCMQVVFAIGQPAHSCSRQKMYHQQRR